MTFTDYSFQSGALAGQIASSASTDVKSTLNQSGGVLAFGLGLSYDASADEYTVLSGAPATGDFFAGVCCKSNIYEDALDANGLAGVENERDFDRLTRGEVWVYTEEAVTPADSVFVRHTAGGGGSILGYFRTDADTASANDVSASCSWAGSYTAGLAKLIVTVT